MKPTQRQITDYMNMLEDTLNHVTLFEIIREMELNLSVSQMSRLGINIAKYARAKGISYKKGVHNQNKCEIEVNEYPADSREAIKAQVYRFLEVQQAAPKHKRKRIKYARI